MIHLLLSRKLFFSVLLICLLAINADALSYFIEVWMDDGVYSHGIPTLILAFGLLYSQRKRLFLSTLRYAVLQLSLVILMVGLIAKEWDYHYVYRLFFVLSAVSMVFSFLAYETIKRVTPIVFIVSLALPIWGPLIYPLRIIAANSVGLLSSLVGIENVVEGTFIQISAGAFNVNNGCSGLRYILVSTIMVTLYKVLYLQSYRNAFKLFAVATLFSVLVNWMRIGYVVYLGEHSQMTDPMIYDHNSIGWYMFSIVCVIIFSYGRMLEVNEQAPTSRSLAAV